MSRYIDADVLIDDLVRNRGFYPALVESAIRNTPTADVEPVYETIRKVQAAFALHFGTYTGKDAVKIADVFKLLDQITKEMLETC